MSRSDDELREALGSYVLDQLDAALRREVDEHLTTCRECRDELAELRPLVDRLGRVHPDDIRPVGVAPPVELDNRIRHALRGPSRGVRRWAPLTAAALAAVAAVVTIVIVQDEPSGPTIIAVPAVEVAQGVTASAGLVDHTWGLEIKLEARGLAAGQRFRMWVVDDDGRQHDAGELLGVARTTITCDMSSSVLLRDAASFRVVDASGQSVIAGDLRS